MESNLGLTRGQIITEGLGRAGRPDLASNARLWLNLFLEKNYTGQDYEWLLKEVDNRIAVEGDPLPSDYERMKVITMTPNRIPVKLVEADEYEWLRRGYGFPQYTTQTFGTPNWAYIDQTLGLIHWVPLPPTGAGQQVVYNYFYYYFPTLPDPTNPSLDSLIPVWGLDNTILITEIYTRALQWSDDLRYAQEKDAVKTLLDESKMNSRDLRAGSPRFKLGKSHKRRRF